MTWEMCTEVTGPSELVNSGPLHERLADGWEPFAITETQFRSWSRQTVWLKRPMARLSAEARDA